MNNPIKAAEYIPVDASTPIVTFSNLTFAVPRRAVDLQVKVSAPVSGSDLPILLLSHGHGNSNYLSSLNGYGPIASFWAAHGFVVIQPTHLDSKTLGLDITGPEGALFWRSRAEDMRYILDHLSEIETGVAGLLGRLDRNRVVAAGHSLGGHTVAMLLGMEVTDPVNGEIVNLADKRVKAGVMMVPPGRGEDLAPFALEHFPVLKTSNFATIAAPGLVIVGDKDVNPRFSPRQDWRADAYHLSPSPKCLLTLFGAEHGLGGVSGYDAGETTDENPERVSVIQRLTWAYFRTALYTGDPAWPQASKALENAAQSVGRIDCK